MHLDIGGVKVKALTQTPHLELFEFIIDKPGEGPGLHFHRKMTEMFYVISGSVIFTIGENTFQANPSEFYTVSPNTIHQWKSCGPVHMLLQFSPAQNQVEYFVGLAQYHQQNVPWSEAIRHLAHKFDNYSV